MPQPDEVGILLLAVKINYRGVTAWQVAWVVSSRTSVKPKSLHDIYH